MIGMLNSISCALALGALTGGASGAVVTVKIADKPAWIVGAGVSYADVSIKTGETLKFLAGPHHDVVLVHTPKTGTHWEQCGPTGITKGATSTIWKSSDFAGATPLVEKHYTPPTCGDFYIACSFPLHCMYGQRIKVTVANADGSKCARPCVNAACVTANSKLTQGEKTKLVDVKPAPNSEFWGQAPYDAIRTVNVGDTVVFKTVGGYHDVATVPTAAALAACDVKDATVHAAWVPMQWIPSGACNASSTCCAASSCGGGGGVATFTFTAKSAGDTYFTCTVGSGLHCKEGQKFQLTVVDPNAKTAATANGVSRIAIYPSLLVVVGLAVFLH